MVVTKHPHLFVKAPPESADFTSHRTGRDNIKFPERANRASHAQFIRNALDKAWKDSCKKRDERRAVSLPTRAGTYIEFQSAPDFDLRTKSLDLRQSGIRLLTVATKTDSSGKETTFATIYVPAGKESVLLKKIDEYENENTRDTKKPKNEPLVASIESLREAVLESFWRDNPSLIPEQAEWCEAWLRCGEDSKTTVTDFSKLCKQLEISVKDGCVSFPERSVVLVMASSDQLREILLSCETIAEFRKAKTTAEFWTGQDNSDQSKWAADLARRVIVDSESRITACVLDTGVNNGHSLLQPLLQDNDCHTVNSDWGTTDKHGHGTLMCGVAGYGNEMESLLQSSETKEIPFQLESVKLIPESGNHNEKELYGLRTKQAISRAEVERPNQNRTVCLAVTSEDHHDEGRPSSWSGSLDQLCAGTEDNIKRQIIVAAGNILSPDEWKRYPESNITQAIQDPGQSWNAITVGAITHKVEIHDTALAETYTPLAVDGQLSPFSTTSYLWDKKWPNKPDIVFEGGNAASDSTGFATEMDDLSILSTNHQPQTAQFGCINATSAATAQATNIAANLWAQYPNAWPETIRALMIHSATWTDGLVKQFSSSDRTSKQNNDQLLKACGFGEPDIRRALASASNSLTLIVEQEIQPFRKRDSGNEYQTNEMHLIDLPWPKGALGELPGETEVRVDVTLSYFIEPGPGEIGWRDKYRYRSHGLDFDLIGPLEEKDEFLKKLNKAALDKDEDEEHSGGSAIEWTIGSNARNRGSIHRDWWITTAANAAESNVIGVFPRTGWWKERYHLNKGASKTRYCLVVTVGTPEQHIDIYTPVANAIELRASVSAT